MPEFMSCGRRAVPGDDHWRSDGTCSYCGSMHPESFLRGVEKGDLVVGPTDKNYKVYLTSAPTEADVRRYREGLKNYGIGLMLAEKGKPGEFDKYADEQVKEGVHGADRGKFYFQHLTYEQMGRFVELHNAGKIRFGYPGHLYVPPYFMKFEE